MTFFFVLNTKKKKILIIVKPIKSLLFSKAKMKFYWASLNEKKKKKY